MGGAVGVWWVWSVIVVWMVWVSASLPQPPVPDTDTTGDVGGYMVPQSEPWDEGEGLVPETASVPVDPKDLPMLEHVHFMDRSTENYLFSGGTPLAADGTFAWDTLHAFLAKKAHQEGGFELPEDFFLVVVSFLDGHDPLEAQYLRTAASFFHSNRGLGKIVRWPMGGEKSDPSVFTEDQQREMALNYPRWSHDRLPQHLSQLRGLLKEKAKNLKKVTNGKPVVYYIHGRSGVSGAAEMRGAYGLVYQFRAFSEVVRECPDEDPSSLHALQWFCLYVPSSPRPRMM